MLDSTAPAPLHPLETLTPCGVDVPHPPPPPLLLEPGALPELCNLAERVRHAVEYIDALDNASLRALVERLSDEAGYALALARTGVSVPRPVKMEIVP